MNLTSLLLLLQEALVMRLQYNDFVLALAVVL